MHQDLNLDFRPATQKFQILKSFTFWVFRTGRLDFISDCTLVEQMWHLSGGHSCWSRHIALLRKDLKHQWIALPRDSGTKQGDEYGGAIFKIQDQPPLTYKFSSSLVSQATDSVIVWRMQGSWSCLQLWNQAFPLPHPFFLKNNSFPRDPHRCFHFTSTKRLFSSSTRNMSRYKVLTSFGFEAPSSRAKGGGGAPNVSSAARSVLNHILTYVTLLTRK